MIVLPVSVFAVVAWLTIACLLGVWIGGEVGFRQGFARGLEADRRPPARLRKRCSAAAGTVLPGWDDFMGRSVSPPRPRLEMLDGGKVLDFKPGDEGA